MKSKFESGDVVKLISGGPNMTIHGIHYDVLANQYVQDMFDCVWFEKDNDPKQEAHYGPFGADDLVIVNKRNT
jgi:uncharacterized protein YodC (DUF2158 family)